MIEQGVIVVQTLEGDERANQRSCLARLHTRGEQKQQRIQIVLFGYDAILAQVLRDDRSRNAMRLVFAGGSIESRCQKRQFVRVRYRETRDGLLEAVPGSAR